MASHARHTREHVVRTQDRERARLDLWLESMVSGQISTLRLLGSDIVHRIQPALPNSPQAQFTGHDYFKESVVF